MTCSKGAFYNGKAKEKQELSYPTIKGQNPAKNRVNADDGLVEVSFKPPLAVLECHVRGHKSRCSMPKQPTPCQPQPMPPTHKIAHAKQNGSAQPHR